MIQDMLLRFFSLPLRVKATDIIFSLHFILLSLAVLYSSVTIFFVLFSDLVNTKIVALSSDHPLSSLLLFLSSSLFLGSVHCEPYSKQSAV